jgi:tripartite-type tricarboxylate transporter receptor subunit TctC
LPGFDAIALNGMFAPAGTPASVISRLNRETLRVIGTADFKDKLVRVGIEAGGSSPEELGSTIKSEMAKMGKVIRDANIHGE